jgi:hypothetical protein
LCCNCKNFDAFKKCDWKKREREGDGRHNSTGTPGGTVLRSHRGDLCFFAAIEKNSMHLKTVIGKK